VKRKTVGGKIRRKEGGGGTAENVWFMSCSGVIKNVYDSKREYVLEDHSLTVAFCLAANILNV
jgi:hypothetical protein